MSEKPQETREEDLLEQIITQGLEKMNAPAQAEAEAEAPPEAGPSGSGPEEGAEAASPPDRKSGSSTVCFYLMLLFGAAFLITLLACFAQRRGNEYAISDLRESMNLSREELLDEIKELEEQNGELGEELGRLTGKLSDLQEHYRKKTHEAEDLFEQYTLALARLSGWENFWALEQSYQAEEYEDCVAILLLENMTEYGSFTPNKEIADRREEITQALIDRGLLPEDRQIRISDYQDLIDAYNAKHPDHGPTGWANVSRETER